MLEVKILGKLPACQHKRQLLYYSLHVQKTCILVHNFTNILLTP